MLNMTSAAQGDRISQALEQSSAILHSLAAASQRPFQELLEVAAQKACELLQTPVCVVWMLDERRQKLTVVAASPNVDREYRKLELSLENPGVSHLLRKHKVGHLIDVSVPHRNFIHNKEAAANGWVSLLTAPMHVQDELIGVLDVYTTTKRQFEPWERALLGIFANQVAQAIRQAEDRPKLDLLLKTLDEISAASDEDDLLRLILDRALELVRSDRGCISRVDWRSGSLSVVCVRGEGYDPAVGDSVSVGVGITGTALQQEKPIWVADVRDWSGIYYPFWADTLSQLAVPILIERAAVRARTNVQYAAKPLGVLNVDSPHRAAFTAFDQYCLWTIARHAASIIDRLEFDKKLEEVSRVESAIATKADRDEIIQGFLDAITHIWGYEYVNLSFVQPELGIIRTHEVRGIAPEKRAAFLRRANHALGSNDIQAHICRSKQIEVPDQFDERFDRNIFEAFDHRNLIRVFVPMIVSPDNRVEGTVEAGYQRGFRKHIYERDVRALKGLVDYATLALEQTKKRLLDRISHELNAPLVGIRSNASFLRHRINELTPFKVGRKLEDIISDSDLLLWQVRQFEFFLGRVPPVSKVEATSVFRDVVLKIVNQLAAVVERDYGLSSKRISIDAAAGAGMKPLYADRGKLNQVVYNLLINAVKYAGENKEQFTIRIGFEQDLREYRIRFMDYGIGIDKGLEERVFDDGFRAPAAERLIVNGSGLGLYISRKLVREIGGDLRLVHLRNPTEFQVILPRSLEEDPSVALY